jgi:ElaB/YqjD/DUF883 family membrane-anchored ribosome-binding protein
MSEFAFFRFRSNDMLSSEEEQHKDEIISLTEEVLQARGIECDSRIAKIPEDQLREILQEVRQKRKKKKKSIASDTKTVTGTEDKQGEDEIQVS